MDKKSKLWRGRFSKDTDRLMQKFNASIGFDRRLLEVDIRGNIAQAESLEQAGVLSKEEKDQVIEGLKQVEAEILSGQYQLTDDLEDIHTAVELRLTELVGPAGAKIHTGRSRNDQVVLDERLYLMDAIDGIVEKITELQSVLVRRAEENLDVIMPGYTHLQRAQPILFSHYGMSLFWMLERDKGRLQDCRARTDSMPIGSGALAGSAFKIDRAEMAERLGFSKVSENSIDAVSDRDYILEFLSAAAILMSHLSRFCEDLIIWCSSEFGFVELDEAFSTGSSAMPQKKNPDSLELIRGKSGRIYGNLMALLTATKGVPLAYSKDIQEDKEPLFDTVETLNDILDVFAGVWDTMEIKSQRMSSCVDDWTLTTDIADYLTKKGVPFRESHTIVGELVKECMSQGVELRDLPLEEFKRFSQSFEDDVYGIMDAVKSVNSRDIKGGTAKSSVQEQIARAKKLNRDDK